MWLGIGYTIPQVGDKNLKPIILGDFIALESALTNLMLLEVGGKVELEN